jgi:hypothetical protein
LLFGFSMTNSAGWDWRTDRIVPSGLYHTDQRQRLSTTLEDDVTESSVAAYVENEPQWSGWLRSIAPFARNATASMSRATSRQMPATADRRLRYAPVRGAAP